MESKCDGILSLLGKKFKIISTCQQLSKLHNLLAYAASIVLSDLKFLYLSFLCHSMGENLPGRQEVRESHLP